MTAVMYVALVPNPRLRDLGPIRIEH
jgi:hypothetical protein